MTSVSRRALSHFAQSSSASRFTAAAAGFLNCSPESGVGYRCILMLLMQSVAVVTLPPTFIQRRLVSGGL